VPGIVGVIGVKPHRPSSCSSRRFSTQPTTAKDCSSATANVPRSKALSR
jgi:hypothetical protein